MVSAGDLYMELITIWCNMKSEKNFNPAKELREVFLEEVVPELSHAGERTQGCGNKNQCWAFPRGSVLKNLPASAGDVGSIPGSGRSLEKEMATHSSILAWRIPWTEEPGEL